MAGVIPYLPPPSFTCVPRQPSPIFSIAPFNFENNMRTESLNSKSDLSGCNLKLCNLHLIPTVG